MAIRARAPQYGGPRRKSAGSIQQRAEAQADQQRKLKEAACSHTFVRGKCVGCGRLR